MTKQAHINITTLVNASKIRREKRAGRDVIVVPSATLPDNVVMNGIRYPAAVIAESFQTLEGKPAPLGHPTVNGQYVSASSPDGIVRSFIGAHNENVRRENGRVYLDKVIDVAFANQSEGGRAVLSAIDKEEPIHTSTGLLATLEPLENAEDGAKHSATSMLFDHDCFLLDQPGAATPEQGVGIFVNSAGDQIEVINSTLEDDIDREIGWAVDNILRAVERKERLPLLERMKASIMRIVQGDPTPDTTEGVALNTKEDKMDKAQFDALSGKVDQLAETVAGLSNLDDKIAAAVGNAFKPLTDRLDAADKAAADKADEDRKALANQVVTAGLLTEEEAKDVPVPALNALLARPKHAFSVNRAFTPQSGKTDRASLAPKGD